MTSDEKFWIKIEDQKFTSRKFFESYLCNILSVPEPPKIYWIKGDSPFMYDSRWRPQFVFIFLDKLEAEILNDHLVKDRIGKVAKTGRKKFLVCKEEWIRTLIEVEEDKTLIGKRIRIKRGPLEEFFGTVDRYDPIKKTYIIKVKLLMTEKEFEQTPDFWEILD